MADHVEQHTLDLSSRTRTIRGSDFRITAFTMGAGALSWSFVALASGLHIQAIVPATFLLVTAFTIRQLDKGRQGERVAFVQTLLGIGLPYLMQALLGGSGPSGMVMVWSFCAMAGALTYQGFRWLAGWIMFDLALLLAFCLFDPVIHVGGPDPSLALPPTSVLLAMNLVGTACVLFGLAYRSLRIQGGVRRSNHVLRAVLTTTNARLAQRNHEIEAGLAHARNIQQALVPKLARGDTGIAQAMVLHQPKDPVGGDLVWQGSQDGHHLLVVADCTGHGVSGALLTMLVSDILNDAVHARRITAPEQVIEHVVRRLAVLLDQRTAMVQDGVEMAVVLIDHRDGAHRYAGYGIGMLEAAPDRCIIHPADLPRPWIGPGHDMGRITSRPIELREGTRLYLFTDGIAHQAGGVSGRQYGRARLQRTLFGLSHWPMDLQREHLRRELEQWQGDRSQVDDILLVAIEPELRATAARKRA